MNKANDGNKSQTKIEKLQEKHDKEDNCRRVVTEMFSKHDQAEHDYLYESS